MDVKQIRDNCNKLQQLKSMLSMEAGARAEVAIEAARQAARKIVKAGEARRWRSTRRRWHGSRCPVCRSWTSTLSRPTSRRRSRSDGRWTCKSKEATVPHPS